MLFDSRNLNRDLAGKSVRGGVTTMTAQGAQFLLQLAGTMILARLLTPSDYGLIGMVMVVVHFAAMFKDAGLAMATVQRETISHEQISTLFWINVLISGFLGLCVLASAPLVARFYGKPELTAVTAVLSLSFLVTGLTIQHQALLRRHMQFGTLAIIHIATYVANLVVTILLAWTGWRYWALVGGTLTTAFSGAALTLLFCPWIPGRMRRGTGVRNMLRFGGYLTGFNFVNYLSRNVDNILIGKFIGADALGLYTRAYSLLMLPITQINVPLTSVAVPALSRLQNSSARLRSYYRRGLTLAGSLGMPVVVFSFVKADEIVHLVLGPGWADTGMIFRVLAVAAFVGTTNGAGSGWIFVALGNVRRQFLTSIPRVIVLIAAFSIGLRWGVVGVAAALSIYTLMTRIPTVMVCFHRTGLRLSDFMASVWRPAATSIVAGVGLYVADLYLPRMNGGAALLPSIVMYVLFYTLLWGIMPGGKGVLLDVFNMWRVLRPSSESGRFSSHDRNGVRAHTSEESLALILAPRRDIYRIDIDPDGIPVSTYGRIEGRYVGRQHSVVAVADKGLDYWNQWVRKPSERRAILCYDWSKHPAEKTHVPTSSEHARTMMLNCANWLCGCFCRKREYGIWEYGYPSFYGTQAGWRSAHAQAEGIQLLLRAHAVTGENRFFQIAMEALPAFAVPCEEGGLRMAIGEGVWWYPKFVDENWAHRPKVLNGMMFSLLGIHELCERGDAFSADLFGKGVKALLACLNRFDAGDWSYYDDAGKRASLHYHGIHILQLHRLYEHTRETVFKTCAERFATYLGKRDADAERAIGTLVDTRNAGDNNCE
jgi:PST family polysaccharide transporter